MPNVRRLILASALSVGFVIACSGSSDVNIPSLESSKSDSGTSTTTDASCEPCEPPNPTCTGTGPCGCAPYVCHELDASVSDGGETGDASVGDASPSDASAGDGGDGSDDCTWSDVNACGPGKYCDSTDCGKGKCVLLGEKEATGKAPVCGCDGVTYWNESVAKKNGMSVKKSGECGDEGVVCPGIVECPNKATCARPVKECSEEGMGTCWMTPTLCPVVDIKVESGKGCGEFACTTECGLIKVSKMFTPCELDIGIGGR